MKHDQVARAQNEKGPKFQQYSRTWLFERPAFQIFAFRTVQKAKKVQKAERLKCEYGFAT
jgi:hypothetical protein